MQAQRLEAQQPPAANQPSEEPSEEVTRRGPFCGSPASRFLVALTFTLIHITIYLTVQNFLASVGGLAFCDVFIVLFLLTYADSLHTNATFSRFLAYRCLGQALLSGFTLGVPIALAPYNFREWRTGMYFCVGWAIALLVCLVHDFIGVSL